MNKKNILIGLGGLWLVASIGSTLAHSNPPVTNQVSWDSPKTKELFYSACADCHSHETSWPWYSFIAPLSFPVIYHVGEAREHFNISIADMGDADEAAEELEEGEMPIEAYTWTHPKAKLSPAEKKALMAGLKKTFGEADEHDKHDHDKH